MYSPFSIVRLAPPRSSVFRPSTSLPFGNVFTRPERIHTCLVGQRLELALVKSFAAPGNRAVAFYQEHGRHVRKAIRTAGRIAALLRIQQYRKVQSKLRGEFSR